MELSRNMHRQVRRNRGISVFLAFSYGFVAIGAGLFHDHAASRDADPCDAAVAAQSHSHDCPADHDGSSCAVCKYLAQKTLPVSLVEEVTSAVLPQAVARVAPPQCTAPVALSWHSRAPPDAV